MIWLIYALFVIFGILANNLEIKDILNNSNKNKYKYKTINIIIFGISILIYLYFVYLTYQYYKKKKTINNTILLIAATITFIAGLLYLYVEIFSTNDSEIIPNEL